MMGPSLTKAPGADGEGQSCPRGRPWKGVPKVRGLKLVSANMYCAIPLTGTTQGHASKSTSVKHSEGYGRMPWGGGRVAAPREAHGLLSRTSEYVTLRGRGALKLLIS